MSDPVPSDEQPPRRRGDAPAGGWWDEPGAWPSAPADDDATDTPAVAVRVDDALDEERLLATGTPTAPTPPAATVQKSETSALLEAGDIRAWIEAVTADRGSNGGGEVTSAEEAAGPAVDEAGDAEVEQPDVADVEVGAAGVPPVEVDEPDDAPVAAESQPTGAVDVTSADEPSPFAPPPPAPAPAYEPPMVRGFEPPTPPGGLPANEYRVDDDDSPDWRAASQDTVELRAVPPLPAPPVADDVISPTPAPAAETAAAEPAPQPTSRVHVVTPPDEPIPAVAPEATPAPATAPARKAAPTARRPAGAKRRPPGDNRPLSPDERPGRRRRRSPGPAVTTPFHRIRGAVGLVLIVLLMGGVVAATIGTVVGLLTLAVRSAIGG